MDDDAKRWLRLVVNGKAAGDPVLRQAVAQLRESGHRVEVRVTWETGDAARYARQARSEGVQVVVAAGGDGTLNEVASGLLQEGVCPDTALAVVPYGTANDFATGMGILQGDPLDALQLAAEGNITPIDVGTVNGRVFVNVTSGGFGAEVTARTPPALKQAVGGAAYSIVGLVTAATMNPHDCKFTLPDGVVEQGRMLMMAVGNGRQCGGGYRVAPFAYLDDGLLDIVAVHDADVSQFPQVLSELRDIRAESNQFVTYAQASSFVIESDQPLQLNLDGEPYRDQRFEFGMRDCALPFVLGPDAPLRATDKV